MNELSAILGATREQDYQQQRFFAGLKGIDLDKERGQSKFKAMQDKISTMSPQEVKKRLDGLQPGSIKSEAVMSGDNDILTQTGATARRDGFGIGMGLQAEVIAADGTVTKL